MARLLTSLALVLAFGASANADVTPAIDAGAFQLEALEPQQIGKGRCALFLWSRSDQPQFILFVTDKPAEAKIRMAGRDRTIQRSTVSGANAFGHFEHQSFTGAGVAFVLDLTFDAARPVRDGAVVKFGALRARTSDGAEAIVPVGGMIGCEPG
jgi:hypothetical protein